jgi:Flp pilus assembly pilin Flp
MLATAIRRFRRDEDGAVTVDWIVLTAGVMVFGVMVASSIISGSTGMSGSVGSSLSTAGVPTIDFNRVD